MMRRIFMVKRTGGHFMPLIIGMILMANTSLAQDRNEEVTIIAPYKPTILDANKMNFQPRIPEQSRVIPSVTYTRRSELFETSIQPEPIEATKKPSEPRKKLQRNLIRAGFGNYITPYLEFFANTRQSKKHTVGVHLKHVSSFGEIKNYAPADFSDTRVQVHGKKFIGENTLSGNIYYDHNLNHYYGFKPGDFPEIEFSKSDIKHRFQTFGLDAGIGSNYTIGEPLNYQVDINYHHIQDNYDAGEHRINAGARLDKIFRFTSITEKQNFGLDMGLDYFINKDSLQEYNGGLLNLTPYISTNFNQYKFHLGIHINYRFDQTNKLRVYPVARVDIKLVENALTLFAGINGSLERVTLRGLSEENPFINATPELGYKNNKFLFDAGITGSIEQNLDFRIGGSYGMIDNMPFFVNDTVNDLLNMFSLAYDDIKLLNLNAELGFKRTDALHLWLGADYFKYYMDTEEQAWHKPEYAFRIGGDYIITQKYILKAEMFIQGSMYARLFDEGEVLSKKINGWTDLNLGFEYRITEQLSAFINLNNVLNNGYFRWYNYPVQKFNVLAGVSFAF